MSAVAGILDYGRLMAAAGDPADIATLAFGGVLPRFRILGLDAATVSRLVQRYFPALDHADGQGAVCNALSEQEFGELLGLLLQHARDDSEETVWMAHAMASACGGDNHLWEDMGLPNRETLSRLIRRFFPTLFHRNSGNLRWKKFLYKQLCDRAEVRLCKAPSCGVCSDYSLCFGPE